MRVPYLGLPNSYRFPDGEKMSSATSASQRRASSLAFFSSPALRIEKVIRRLTGFSIVFSCTFPLVILLYFQIVQLQREIRYCRLKEDPSASQFFMHTVTMYVHSELCRMESKLPGLDLTSPTLVNAGRIWNGLRHTKVRKRNRLEQHILTLINN
ncbi:hypothetical protein SUGI_0206160 [Cryptomeria japonica]|nr:hypothetical protein SUGI_0206160 [Cryptomeria japonica]